MGRKEVEYEFMGPPGALFIMISLPAVCYALQLFCHADACVGVRSLLSMEFRALENVQLFSIRAMAVFVAWFAFCATLHLLLPGVRAKGVKLANGKSLEYKLNGILVLMISVPLSLCLGFGGYVNLSWVFDNLIQLLTAAIVFSSSMSCCLYLLSFRKGVLLSSGGQSGNPVYDFFIGRELNPRSGAFDWKAFCELVPGLVGWVMLDIAFAHKQYVSLGYVTNSMVMVCVFHFWYVLDALWFEKAILTTMDITTDGFGFMLAFGDLAWVPFVYSLQAKYLVDYPIQLSPLHAGAIVSLNILGYIIFRGSNNQKNEFRTNPRSPKVSHLKTLQTKRGTKLIVSGWWGTARHINYFGDWLLGLSWCLPCGLDHLIPYFYAVYFAILLVHRDRRDDHACREKYGKDWERYCSSVPYRLVPWLY